MEKTDYSIAYGYCMLSVVPVRGKPSNTSEMVTQLLFGECFSVIEKRSGWAQIRTLFDDYTGWIDSQQYCTISEEDYRVLARQPINCCLDLVQILTDHSNNRMMAITLGCSLPGIANHAFKIANHDYSFEGSYSNPNAKIYPSQVVENAYLYLHTPYLWGGRTPFGIDCSGLVQMAYKLTGISLYRDTADQATQGETVNLLSETLPGDVAFFDNNEGDIVHAGILVNQHTIIHASGQVRSDSIDHYGIYNRNGKGYSHKLRLIKRIL